MHTVALTYRKMAGIIGALLTMTTFPLTADAAVSAVRTVSVQVNKISDDLEEYVAAKAGETQENTPGAVDDASSDLELGCEDGTGINPQLIGVRFESIPLAKNCVITEAHIEFELDATAKNGDPAVLTIRAEANDNPVTFVSELNNLSSRTFTTDSVVWTIAPESLQVINGKGSTADISTLVQALVNRSGWAAGNAMAFFLQGTGTREVEAYDGEPTAAAKLYISYELSSDAVVDSDYTTPSVTAMKMAFMTAGADSADSVAALAALVDKTNPYSIAATFNGDPSTRMGFAWFNNAGISGGMVKIVEGSAADLSDFATPAFEIPAVTTTATDLNYNATRNTLSTLAGIADNTKKSYAVNKALATGLTPGTTYSYVVGLEGAWSDIGTFTTAAADADSFTFIYFTDPQAANDEMFDISQKTIHAATSTCPEASFILSCGDLVESSGSTNSEWEYERFFTTQQDVWLDYPFVPVTGNHDKSANKNFTNHFNTAVTAFDSAAATTPGSVYSFVYGNALFMAMSFEDYSVAGYLDPLKKWVRAQVVANPDVSWKIAYYHKTIYTGSKSHQSDDDGTTVRNAMAPLFDSLGIHLAMQGHDHVYEIMGPIYDGALVDGAVSGTTAATVHDTLNVNGVAGGTFDVSEGTLYFLNNSAGKKKYIPRTETEMDAADSALGVDNYFDLFTGRLGQTGEPTFSTVTVTTDSIFVSTYTVDDNGDATLFDAFTVVASGASPIVNASASHPSKAGVRFDGAKNRLVVSGATGVSRIALYNAAGRQLLVNQVSAGACSIDMGSLSAGLYIVKLDGRGVSNTFNIVRN